MNKECKTCGAPRTSHSGNCGYCNAYISPFSEWDDEAAEKVMREHLNEDIITPISNSIRKYYNAIHSAPIYMNYRCNIYGQLI